MRAHRMRASNHVVFPKVSSIQGTSVITNGITATLPAAVAGDLFVAVVNVIDKPTITTPSGWTRLALVSGSASNDASTAVYVKVASGGDPNPVFVLSAVCACTVSMLRITDWDSGISNVFASLQALSATASPTPPSITAPWDTVNNLYLVFAACNGGAWIFNSRPPGYPLYNIATLSTNNTQIILAGAELASKTEAPGSFSTSSAKANVGTIVIKGG